MIDLNHQQVWK